MVSSLLSPCWRALKRQGTSAKRSGLGAEAKRSSRILKPCCDRPCTASSNAARVMTKKPLMGSLSSAWSTSRETRPPAAAKPLPEGIKALSALAVDVTAAHHHIEIFGAEPMHHLRQHRVVVLEVAIHDRETAAPKTTERPRRRQSTGRAGRGRRMTRTRRSRRAISFAAFAVPSGESSSTKITSQAIPFRAAWRRATTAGTLPASLKVGTTTVSSIAPA